MGSDNAVSRMVPLLLRLTRDLITDEARHERGRSLPGS
ncbi:hypothetical protein RD1_3857 [Roseobacter denitrificans OCh 114]|uniref:Uncharacterized protein n=1 Tax=Roseobacter denitrificans (strain ATCC 33942 / OCh 114) TaxID=375451 RepID=Q161M4_ROSDO|nr:hypothetical protein RD1_3857 [Roseobacter denitrificans OCh 114]